MATPDPAQSTAAIQAFLATFGIAIWLIIVGAIVLQLVCNWIIATKAGYSGVLSLLMLIPLVNAVVFFIFVFSKWPVQSEIEALRARLVAQTPPGGYPPQTTPGTAITQ